MNNIIIESLKKVAGSGRKTTSEQQGVKSNVDRFSSYSLEKNSIHTIRMYAYEMLSLYLDRINEKIISRGFSFNRIKDSLGLKDLQLQLTSNNSQPVFNNPVVYYSIADIVKTSYMGNLNDDYKHVYEDFEYDLFHCNVKTGCKVYYAFYFGGFRGNNPPERKELLGIVKVRPLEEKDANGKITIKYQANIGDRTVTFDPRLVFRTPYAKNLNAFLLGLEGIITLLVNSKNSVINGTSDYKIFRDKAAFLDKDSNDYKIFKERLQPFIDGETNSLILGNGLELEITKGESSSETVTVAETTFVKDMMAFIAERPRTIMFGEPVSGLNSSNEEDLEKEEVFLTSKAKLDFIPIFKCFCDAFDLKDTEDLIFNSYFEAIRTIRLTQEFDDDAVDEAILYEKRKAYYNILNMKGTPPPIEEDVFENRNGDQNDDEK